jgi:two-component system, chemotaxis family, CheB/CheR fusion protein
MGASDVKFLIVGIGASAGGIQALEGFFRGVKADCGMAFVIVTHLSPDRESQLHDIVSRYTDMPVAIAQDGARVEPGWVYVLPENALLSVEKRRLHVRKPNEFQRERKPIDIFFSALAKDQAEYAVGVVLSGGDGDGTLGIKAIKEHGGLTLAQVANGSGPRYPDMPQTAIASGLVDLAVPAEEMGAKLVQFARGLHLRDDQDQYKGGNVRVQAAQEAIYNILRKQTGHEFSGYKEKTLLRRVHRRMQVLQLDTLDAYVERIQQDTVEVRNLFRDLLINVTNFFRDADAFNALTTTVIPHLFEDKGADQTVRVWVPGCSTGEEVYSLAILLREHAAALPEAPRVQIFATDIDEPALTVARAARYPEALLDGVSPERRDRFFINDGASYVVNRAVRDMCTFSPHSVIRDPPFSRIDLISCRNLLIYFGPGIQSTAIPTFHYSLRPGGYLFLGTSEGLGQHPHLFATLDKKNRIFQRRAHEPARLPTGISSALSRFPGGGSPARYRARGERSLRETVETQILDHFAPAHVVVNAEGDIVYYSSRTGKYLEAPQGVPNRQLSTMARKGLRLDLRNALSEAMETRQTVTRENIAIDEDGDRVQMISLMIEPLAERNKEEPLFLVLFIDVGPVRCRSEAESRLPRPSDVDQVDLERELRDARERMQATIEEYETALEELKSTNEELVSINEEAQSTNEELEASKEEMQSLNEELNTINAELSRKVEELDRANSDLKNIFESTQIATVFLDRDLVIRSFTPAASKFFHLIPSDAGRPLTDLAGHLAYPEFKRDIQAVFDTGEMIEQRLTRDEKGAHYLVRLIPYREADAAIRGVVVTIIDVTGIAEAEEHQKILIAELNHRVKNMLAVVISLVNQMARRASSPEAFQTALIGRLHSMSRAFELLSRENWTEASLGELVRQELAPFDLKRIAVKGPDINLKPRQSLSVGMLVHELATNAAKYGALSVSSGRIEIEWSKTESEGQFNLFWRERDGPKITKSTQRGFGLTLVEREVQYNLRGKAEIDFEPDGLAVALEIPLIR